VTTAGSLAGGLEELGRGRYDALVLDADACGNGDKSADVLARHPEVTGILVLGPDAPPDAAVASLRAGWAEALARPLSREQMLTGLTAALGRALEARERIRTATLAPLARLSEEFLINLDLDALLEEVVHIAKREARCDRVSLMLVENRELRIRAAVGLDKQVVATWRGEVGVGIAGVTAATGETVIINQGEEDERFVQHLRDGKITSAISMPLKVRNKIIGVLNLSNFMGRERFFASDVQFLSLLAGQAAVAIQNANLYNTLQTSYLHTIVGLANALEARDASLSGHSTKVLQHSLNIGQKLGLSTRELDDIRNAAMLHDIGKIGIRDAILLKPGKLDDSEWRILRTHPEVGGRIISPVRHLARCVPLILHHHERWDGTGYPSGLAGVEIPLGARIIAVADAYDAMCSHRAYRNALGHEFAINELKRVAGSQLDPDLVAVFLEVVEVEGNAPEA
jgi:HD-GYP domain-containing protein (c-di-GMP phosphodiesterase class II)